MPRFRVNDRVRVKFGVDRGHYGTIRSCGGDDGTYYGVKLDCHDAEVGYSEYELDAARPRPTKPLWQYEGQSDQRGVYVPQEVAVCPECDGELIARAMEWESETGRPVATGIELECRRELAEEPTDTSHRWTQDRWQRVRDSVATWCGARVDFGK